jgi:hypothetical protein
MENSHSTAGMAMCVSHLEVLCRIGLLQATGTMSWAVQGGVLIGDAQRRPEQRYTSRTALQSLLGYVDQRNQKDRSSSSGTMQVLSCTA